MSRPFGSVSPPQANAHREPCGHCRRVAATIVRLHRPRSDNQTGEAYSSDDAFCSPDCANIWWAKHTAPDWLHDW